VAIWQQTPRPLLSSHVLSLVVSCRSDLPTTSHHQLKQITSIIAIITEMLTTTTDKILCDKLYAPQVTVIHRGHSRDVARHWHEGSSALPN